MSDEVDQEKPEWGPLAPILVFAPAMLLIVYGLEAAGFDRSHWGVIAAAGFSASLGTSWLWPIKRKKTRR
jgi:hypothetical protein